MSMLLDLGLFLRENNVIRLDKKTGEKIIIPISATLRGFLFTIACRIGSDPYSWVSQETLAEELGMSVIGIKKLSKKASETNLIEVIPNPSDKRKRMYRPAKFLVNYTQKRREKLSTEDGLGTFFEIKKVYKRTPNNPKKVSKSIPSRYTNVSRISHKNNENIKQNQTLTNENKTPKGHETTIISKQPDAPAEKRGLISESFYPNRENQKLADQIGIKVGKTGVYLIRKFIEVMNKYNVKAEDFDRRFKEFLLKELPSKQFKPSGSGAKCVTAFL